MRIYSLLLWMLIILVSCTGNLKQEEKLTEADFNQITTERYSMKLPTYMKVAKSLNDDASLQYQNVFKEVYTIVIDESKEEFIQTFVDLGEYDSAVSALDNYSRVQMGNMEEASTISSRSPFKDVKISGLAARQIQFDGTVEDVKYEIAYFMTFIESDDRLYMMMAWTLADRKEKYRNTFDAMARSFKEL